MGQLDASIVTVALPTLQRTFHASVGAVTWVGLSYLLVLVATVVAVGRFADMWGRKLLYVYGFGVFIIGSALCGLAPGLGWLIGFRALQAVGAALLQANSVAIIVLAVPKPSLGQGHRDPGRRPGRGTGPRPDRGRPPPRRRRVAADLLRQRAVRPPRHDRRGPADPAEPQPPGPDAVRLDGLRPVLPRGRRHCSPPSRSGTPVDGPHRRSSGSSWADRASSWRSSTASGGATSRCSTSSCSAGRVSAPGSRAGCCPTW